MISQSYAGYSESATIVAEASPPGRGGISLLRISGKEAFSIVSKLLDRELPEPNHTRFAILYNNNAIRSSIDDVMVSVFRAPRSYTGEDVIEISTHGSPIVINEALEAIYREGARPAKPGEFTLRAFLNDKIDLTQAEAIGDLIGAKSKEAANQALRQLEGGIGKTANAVSDKIMHVLTYCELELDFLDEDIILLDKEEKLSQVEQIISDLSRMLVGYSKTRNLRKGVIVAIIGAPNVGKSSIFNVLANEDKAIVHNTPGTTRDVLEAKCLINGVEFSLFDTAGLRTTPDEIEDEGVNRAINAAKKADIVIYVTAPDVKQHDYNQLSDTIQTIHVANKADIEHTAPESGEIAVSALKGIGIEELKRVLYERTISDDGITEGTISRERHFTAVNKAITAMNACKEDIADGRSGEFLAESLREAVSAMEELTGKIRLDNLLDEIFSEFCIGK